MCLTSLEVRAWLLVEASSRQGHGEGGEQREEERGTSIWRDFIQSVWCLRAAIQDASTQAQHS